MSEQLSPNFTEAEFACHHCGCLPDSGVNMQLVVLLEFVRLYFGGAPVTINSGYRCATHNAACGGASGSQHLLGTAADIVVSNVPPSEVYALLDPWHTGGLGKYDTFTHIDVRGSKARWSG